MKYHKISLRNRTALVAGMSLTLLVAVLGGNVQAQTLGAAVNNAANVGDPIQSKNKNNKSIKSPHSARKQAAKRLRQLHQQKNQQKLQNWAKAHKGYTGSGVAGDSFSNTTIPAASGGAK